MDPLHRLALIGIGATGADIERFVREARQIARRSKRGLTYNDVAAAIGRTKPPVSQQTLWRRAVHEAGHIIVRAALDIGQATSVTINGPNGASYVESTYELSELQNETGLAGVIAVTLAGRAAEMLFIGDVSAGSGGARHSDLARATRMALDMETKFGFSKEHPLVYRGRRNSRRLREDRGQLLSAVNDRLGAGHNLATETLPSHRHETLEVARTLVTCTSMSGNELSKLLGSLGLGPKKSP
ncbi:ATP-dependent Zn protease [Rhizobiaceae sp. 2RAB30]